MRGKSHSHNNISWSDVAFNRIEVYLECRLYEFDTCIVESIDCELSKDDLNRKIDLLFGFGNSSRV